MRNKNKSLDPPPFADPFAGDRGHSNNRRLLTGTQGRKPQPAENKKKQNAWQKTPPANRSLPRHRGCNFHVLRTFPRAQAAKQPSSQRSPCSMAPVRLCPFDAPACVLIKSGASPSQKSSGKQRHLRALGAAPSPPQQQQLLQRHQQQLQLQRRDSGNMALAAVIDMHRNGGDTRGVATGLGVDKGVFGTPLFPILVHYIVCVRAPGNPSETSHRVLTRPEQKKMYNSTLS